MSQFIIHKFHNTQWEVPSRYQNLRPIGHGAFGSVCSCFDTLLNKDVAIKRLVRPFDTNGLAKRTYREIMILLHMDHENVISLLDVFTPQTTLESFQDVYLVTQLMEANLEGIMHIQQLSNDQIRYIIYQILCALKYIHTADIVHRDLKPSNIGVNSNCDLRILDFGLARQIEDLMTGYVVTRWYRAPEIKMNWMNYNKQVDIWSVGCIMAELFMRRALFPGHDHIDEVMKIIKVTGSPDEEFISKIVNEDMRSYIRNNMLSVPRENFYNYFGPFIKDSNALDLLDRILVLDPDRRISVTDALGHPYVADDHDNTEEPVAPMFQDPLAGFENLDCDTLKMITWETIKEYSASQGNPGL